MPAMRWLLPMALVACEPEPVDPYPLDDVLRFSDLQAKGTHNSTHVQTTDRPEWRYTHAPLADQAETQGVRQFELDLWFDDDAGRFEVFHIPFLDEGTTCRELSRCLSDLKGWSDDHLDHHPLLVLLEVKDAWDPEVGPARLDALDAEILAVWPEERLVTPDLVRGDAADLPEALATTGWPTLRVLRGRALFVLHVGGEWRDAYTGGLTTADRPLFPDAMGDLALPISAVHTMNDPYDPAIATVVDAGHLVRTRADGDTVQARTNDGSQRDQALASGAHFVSTDFPAPVDWTEYRVDIPDGTPSRCNPRTAPSPCTSEAIEAP